MAEHGLLDNPIVVEEICDRLAGGEALSVICADNHMPSDDTIYRRMAKDEAFAGTIARARAAQQEAIADQIVDMADAADSEDWQVVKLRIWARQWRAGKLAPKRFGDSALLKHADADGNKLPTRVVVTYVSGDAEK